MTEYIQAVYLQKGQKIGFVEAKCAQSNSYSWYQEYLERWYYTADFAEYLAEYDSVISKNHEKISSIKQNLNTIYSDLESFQRWKFSWSSYEIIEFNRLADAYEAKADRFNQSVQIFNSQVEDYNAEVAKYNKLTQGIQEAIYYVTETLVSPYTLHPISLPAVPPPCVLVKPPSIATHLYPSLSDIDSKLRFIDDSYYNIPKPDRQSVKKCERYADKNFVVKDFELWW